MDRNSEELGGALKDKSPYRNTLHKKVCDSSLEQMSVSRFVLKEINLRM